jgi:hypothetical protein
LEEAIDLSGDRQILEVKYIYIFSVLPIFDKINHEYRNHILNWSKKEQDSQIRFKEQLIAEASSFNSLVIKPEQPKKC